MKDCGLEDFVGYSIESNNTIAKRDCDLCEYNPCERDCPLRIGYYFKRIKK